MTDVPIYLDYNATAPVDRRVAEAMAPFLFDHWGNPSSGHVLGRDSRAAIDRARDAVAALIGCSPGEVVFTSGGTEASNMAIFGIAEARATDGKHLITSAVEHPATLGPCRYLAERRGYRLTVLPVDADGRVDPAELERAIDDETILVSVMHANNEVGTIQPIAELSAIAHAHGAWMHVDAAQSVGKIPVDRDELGADFISIAGHKLCAPKGVGALIAREGLAIDNLMFGAGHEQGRRPGTENVLEVVGLGRAAAIARDELADAPGHSAALRDRLEGALRDGVDGLRVFGHPTLRLPNTLNASFPGVYGADLVASLGDRVCASSGAACHSGQVYMSPVLCAMGVDEAAAKGSVRLSVGRFTTEEDVDRGAAIVIDAWRALRDG